MQTLTDFIGEVAAHLFWLKAATILNTTLLCWVLVKLYRGSKGR